jgi:hypothetical protein
VRAHAVRARPARASTAGLRLNHTRPCTGVLRCALLALLVGPGHGQRLSTTSEGLSAECSGTADTVPASCTGTADPTTPEVAAACTGTANATVDEVPATCTGTSTWVSSPAVAASCTGGTGLSTYSELGTGICENSIFLPEGEQVTRLDVSDPLYDEDPAAECMNRCIAASGSVELGTVFDADIVPHDGSAVPSVNDLAVADQFTLPNAFSVTLSVLTGTSFDGGMGLILLGDNSGWGQGHVYFSVTGVGNLRVHLQAMPGSVLTGPTSLETSTQYELGFSWDGVSAAIFIDGVQDAASALPSPQQGYPQTITRVTLGGGSHETVQGGWIETFSDGGSISDPVIR